jgi:hypothetical protein
MSRQHPQQSSSSSSEPDVDVAESRKRKRKVEGGPKKKKLKIGPQKKKKRGPLRMYSNKMKKKFLIEFEASRMSQAEFCRQNNLDKNCISRWLKKKKYLYSMTDRELRRRKISDIENMWKKHSIFPVQQKKLYDEFIRRRSLGLNCGHKWLRIKMNYICKEDAQKNEEFAKNFNNKERKFGTSWTSRFCKRWDISSQKRTTKSTKNVFVTLHAIINYLYWVIYLMPRAPPAGVVPPEEIDEHILKLRNELKPQLKKEKKKKQKKKKKKEKKQGSIENADESKDSVYETDEQSETDEESFSWTPSDSDENE